MAWWGWALIWTALILGLLGMLAWFAIRLFRKAMKTADALAELGDKMAVLENAFAGADATTQQKPRFSPAIFQDAAELGFLRQQERAEHGRRRQARRDSRIDRGKLLTHTPTNLEDTASCFRT
ncbi:hypothetical protein GCM10022381_09280 [Leifsonia kafniensis]|uniref:Uncharacterized protein n=1 Tax=Leifsonia kafniensis TaxID=475957 RepID=A0ABP7K8N9_9MICO